MTHYADIAEEQHQKWLKKQIPCEICDDRIVNKDFPGDGLCDRCRREVNRMKYEEKVRKYLRENK